jgi:hypothetical protein
VVDDCRIAFFAQPKVFVDPALSVNADVFGDLSCLRRLARRVGWQRCLGMERRCTRAAQQRSDEAVHESSCDSGDLLASGL